MLRNPRSFPACPFVFLLAASMFVAAAAAGCGAGGSAPKTRYALAATTRALQAGDTWNYAASFKEKGVGGAFESRYRVDVRVTSATLSGESILAKATIERAHDGYPESRPAIDYIRQTNSGDIMLLGRRDGLGGSLGPGGALEDRFFLPQRVLPGAWSEGTNLDYRLNVVGRPEGWPTLEEAATVTVLGTEEVETPLGRFATWKVHVQYDVTALTKGGGVEATYWYAPQLGAFVKLVEAGFTSPDREVYDEQTFLLAGTNVPLGEPAHAP